MPKASAGNRRRRIPRASIVFTVITD